MRVKTIKALSTVACWIQRVFEVRLPVDALYGLRTRLRAEVSSDVRIQQWIERERASVNRASPF